MKSNYLVERQDDLHGLDCLKKTLPKRAVEQFSKSDLLAACELAEAQVMPIDARTMALHLERMAVHYPDRSLSGGEQRIVNADWLRLCGDVPADLFCAAVDRWIMSPERFFPTPGQLAQFWKDEFSARRGMAKRAAEVRSLLDVR